MEITEVRVYPRNGNDGGLKAFASITLDGTFAVKDLRVIEGEKGLFVSMPAKKLPDGRYLDLAHAITKEFSARIQAEVLEAYRRRAAS